MTNNLNELSDRHTIRNHDFGDPLRPCSLRVTPSSRLQIDQKPRDAVIRIQACFIHSNPQSESNDK